MKKRICLLFALCVMMAMIGFCVYAEETIVMTVEYQKGTTTAKDSYSAFHKGWTKAMELARDKSYQNVKVTLHQDWIATDGKMTPDYWNDLGFNWDAINFVGGCNITLNLNGHIIDRDLNDWQYNGEVMYVNTGAVVTIENGTITGGFSCNGAGGIHISGGSLTLNNVHVIGNQVEDDDGGAIAIYDGTLVMTGGSIQNNIAYTEDLDCIGAGIFVEGGNVTLYGVEIIGNQNIDGGGSSRGGGIAVWGGSVSLDQCVLSENYAEGHAGAIGVFDGKLSVSNSDIIGNSCGTNGSAVYFIGGTATFENCNIYENVSPDGYYDMYATAYSDENGGKYTLTNCYFSGKLLDKVNAITWKDSAANPIRHQSLLATLLHPGTLAICAGVIVVIGAAIAAVIVIHRKKRR